MSKRTVRDLDVKGKVLVRVDFNVPRAEMSLTTTELWLL